MKGKHIIVGVSAGIAAYKAIEVVSRLRKAGAEVKVVMTKNATHIATPMTFGEISGHPVAVDMWEEIHDWNVEHIALATWADAYIVVPATANVIGKIRAGIADDMLTTTIMATPAPKFLCPAMNTEMFNNPIVQRNLKDLSSLGYHIMQPDAGWLACGVTGVGRLPAPEEIVNWLTEELHSLDGTGKLAVHLLSRTEPLSSKLLGEHSLLLNLPFHLQKGCRCKLSSICSSVLLFCVTSISC